MYYNILLSDPEVLNPALFFIWSKCCSPWLTGILTFIPFVSPSLILAQSDFFDKWLWASSLPLSWCFSCKQGLPGQLYSSAFCVQRLFSWQVLVFGIIALTMALTSESWAGTELCEAIFPSKLQHWESVSYLFRDPIRRSKGWEMMDVQNP